MVSLGNISVGVSLDGVEEVISQTEELKESIEGVEQPAETSTDSIEDMSEQMEELEETSEDTIAPLQRQDSWFGLTSDSAGGLSESIGSLTSVLGGLGLVSALSSVLSYLGLSGGLAGVIATVKAGIAGLVGAVSSTTLALGGLAVGTALVGSELLGITDISDDVINKADKIVESWTGIEDPISKSIDFIINKLVQLDNKISQFDSPLNTNPFLAGMPKLNMIRAGTKTGMDLTGIDNPLSIFPGVDSSADSSTSGKTEKTENNVNVESPQLRITDSRNFSDMNRREKREFAEMIAEKMADDVKNEIR